MASEFTVILVVLVGLIFPIYILLTYKKVNTNIHQNEKYRLIDYKQTLLILWSLTLLVLINYFIYKQPSLNFYPKFSLINIGLTVLILAFTYIQYTTTKVSTETARATKEKLKEVYHYLPKTDSELKWFWFLSISAGICEELLFRLFLFEYTIENVNLTIALLLPNIIFSITHIGSGKSNIITSFVLGLLFSVIYYFTDNIWLAMILHASIDINAGILGYRINKMTENEK